MKLIEFDRDTIIDETKSFFYNASIADKIADAMRHAPYKEDEDEVSLYRHAATYISLFGDCIRGSFSRLYHDAVKNDLRLLGILECSPGILEYENAASDVFKLGLNNNPIAYEVRILYDGIEVYARCRDVEVCSRSLCNDIGNGRKFVKYVYDLLQKEYDRAYSDTYASIKTAFAAWINDHAHDIPGVLDIDVAKPCKRLTHTTSEYSAWVYSRTVNIHDIDGEFLIGLDVNAPTEDPAAYNIVITALDKALDKGKAAAKTKQKKTAASLISSSSLWRKDLLQPLCDRMEKEIREGNKAAYVREKAAINEYCKNDIYITKKVFNTRFDCGNRKEGCARNKAAYAREKIADIVIIRAYDGDYIKVFWNDGTISGVRYDALIGKDNIGWAIMARYITQKEVYRIFPLGIVPPAGMFDLHYNDVSMSHDCCAIANTIKLCKLLHGRRTVITWADGSTTSLKCSESDYAEGLYSKSSGILYAMLKHYRGDDFYEELEHYKPLIAWFKKCENGVPCDPN